MPARNFITHNFGWKLLSVVLATVTWYFIDSNFTQPGTTGKSTPEITTMQGGFSAVPIMLMTRLGDTNRYQVTPESVSVVISGGENEVNRTQLRQVHAFVEVTDSQNEQLFSRTVQIQLPGDCKVVSVTPAKATVERIRATK